MDSKNNINENNNKNDLNIKELLSNNNIFQKDNNNLCNKETEENQKKIEAEKKINTEQSNNIINIDEKKELKEEKKEGINNSANTINKKPKKNQVPISQWGCRSLNVYEKIKEVGKGSYGIVYKARYKGPEGFNIPEIVALKKIKTEHEEEGFPISALREIRILKRFNHKNILDILEVVVSEPKGGKQDAYMVFEYMDHDLATLICNNIKYELPQIKYIFHELIEGLDCLHKNNVIHRDLKPGNILLNNKGEVKIGDFGLSRFYNNSPNIKNKEYTNYVITINYRAPELALGTKIYSTEVDIWSMGCIFLEILTGEMVFYIEKGYTKETEKNVLFSTICKKCGTPTEETWPGISQYPNYKDLMNWIKNKKYENKIQKKYYPNIDDVTFDLIRRMLILNPKERITLEQIKNHPFFTTHEPKMCEAKDMPKIEEEMHFYEYRLKEEEKENQKEQQIGKSDYPQRKGSYLEKKRKHPK